MDSGTVRNIGDDLRKMVSELGKRHGINVKVGVIRYDTTGFRVTLEASEMTEGGVDAKAQAEWNAATSYPPMAHGLTKDDFGRTFAQGGHVFKIIGWRLRSRKRPVLVTNGTKQFVFSAEAVARLLGRSAS